MASLTTSKGGVPLLGRQQIPSRCLPAGAVVPECQLPPQFSDVGVAKKGKSHKIEWNNIYSHGEETKQGLFSDCWQRASVLHGQWTSLGNPQAWRWSAHMPLVLQAQDLIPFPLGTDTAVRLTMYPLWHTCVIRREKYISGLDQGKILSKKCAHHRL